MYFTVNASDEHDAAFGRATSIVVSFVLALNKVIIVAVTTILVLHVGNGRSEHVCLDIMFIGNVHRKTR